MGNEKVTDSVSSIPSTVDTAIGKDEIINIPQSSSSEATCSPQFSRRAGLNKSRNSTKPIARSSLSPSSESRSTPEDSRAKLSEEIATRQLLDRSLAIFQALARFQTCILYLFNTVSRLQDTLKILLPSQHPVSDDKETRNDSGIEPVNVSEDPKMVSKTIKTLVDGKSLHTQISLENENNNTKSAIISRNGEKGKLETIVGISNASSYPSSINTTDGSSASIIPSSEDSGKGLESPFHSFKKVFRFLRKYAGIIFALQASMCMSVVTLIVKYMEGYSPVSKVVWRLQGVLFPSLWIILYVKYYKDRSVIAWKKTANGGTTRSTHWKWQIFILLVLRGLVGCSADIFQYYSLKYLPLADSTVISFSTPIFVCIVAHFVLREQCGIVPIFTAILTLSGVIVISKPPILTGEEVMNSQVLLGNILAILCMICGTFTTVIMRYLQHVHFAMTMLALGIFGTIEGLLVTLFTTPFEFPDVMNYMDWLFAGIIAGLFFLGQLLMTLALQREEAGVVSLLRCCDVLFAFVWQVYFLHQNADTLSYIGAAIVTLGVCITALRKWVSELPEHSLLRKRLGFILR